MSEPNRPPSTANGGDDPSGAAKDPGVTLSAGAQSELNRLLTIGHTVFGVAHELNNILQVIAGYSELLQVRGGLPDDASAKVVKIASQAARAAERITELLTIARPDAAGGRAVIDVRRPVDLAVSLRRHAAARVHITIALDSPAADACPALASAQRVQLAVMNLIMNAERALAGQADAEIRVALTRSNGRVTVTVADNGPGVATAIQARLFEPFFSTYPDGVGLGLVTARRVAESMGGRCLFDPSAAKGALFRLELPEAAKNV